MRCNCRTVQNGARLWAQETAAAILAQSRATESAVDTAAAEPQEEPMNRYIYPLPVTCCTGCCSGDSAALDRILETLCTQNQLLLDLTGAVNALTAAVLSVRNSLTS
ncbi:MAG: hypothetical protein HFE97_10525 [Oscillospiraceae bacterium]|nr:hypothetical protein [Oscillospiraceae bacterium]